MNEENIKQIEFRLKKLKETYKAIGAGTGGIKVKRWMELGSRAETLRALLYEDFENLAGAVSVEFDMVYRQRLLDLMLSIFKECRR